ncbi:MAG: mannonate dehydratase [Rhizomicrobium sp.]
MKDEQPDFAHRAKRSRQYFETDAGLSRRALGLIAMGGAAAVAALGNLRAANAMASDSLKNGGGIKLCGQGSTNPTDDDLKFMNEVGYNYVYATATRGAMLTTDEQLAAKKRYADAGITLHSIRYLLGGKGGNDINTMLLGLPGADESLESVRSWIRSTGKDGAGFDYTGSRLMITGVWEDGMVDIRGGAMEREFDPTNPNVHRGDFLGDLAPDAKHPERGLNTLYWGRECGYDEVMANFKKYIAEGLGPVLDENNVFLAFHPDDPPVFESLGGVARIMCNYARYKAMFAAANSSHIGIQMCCGTWNEGGPKMGKDLLSVLKEFNTLKKYREIHFRNISSPPVKGVPNFHETFQDNGYYDMYKIMKTLMDIAFQGLVHLDHHPNNMPGSPYSYLAYVAGFMHACLVRAKAEPKGTL